MELILDFYELQCFQISGFRFFQNSLIRILVNLLLFTSFELELSPITVLPRHSVTPAEKLD